MSSQDMSINLDAAQQTFLAECEDLLRSMEDGLLQLEDDVSDTEALNAVFRAAHTIKGSSGLFGFDAIVAFTHIAENVLDRWRAGELSPDDQLIALMLECGDHIGQLVERIAREGEALSPEQVQRGEGLKSRLENYLDKPEAGRSHGQAMTSSPPGPDPDAQTRGAWHISLRFGPDVLRMGMDPLSIIRYLATIGEIKAIQTIDDALPIPESMDPETCYLGYEISLRTQADKQTIEGVFEFVRDDCAIRILPPQHTVAEVMDLIGDLPEDDLRLGEILVRCGALTARELKDALAEQSRQAAHPPIPALGTVLVEQGAVRDVHVEAALVKQQQTKEKKAAESKLIRVHADKIDSLIDLVGELVIAGSAANLAANRATDVTLNEATGEVLRLVEGIRDRALKLRMVQIGETFHRFNRVVRDVSKELGKDIQLTITGAETELDKSVVEQIGDPLVHLVRNSIDHGIESAEVRASRGKPTTGHLHLSARHESGAIVIEVADDGGGLNRQRILDKARERGIAAANGAPSDQEIDRLIFEPGFSTAEQVTNLSGRGVGMDVVRRNIESLRGTIDIESQEGVGTKMIIRLPLTLAIIDGFLMSVGSRSFVVPLDLVDECIELTDAHRKAAGDRHFIDLRGEALPFVRLRELLALPGEQGRRENVIVVQYAGRRAGLVVDALHGELQTVIKPLSKLFRGLKGVSGSTILGSGEVALILDVPALVQLVQSSEDHQMIA